MATSLAHVATSGYLEKEVERILRDYNVKLANFMEGILVRIAGNLNAEGLIERTTVDRMRTIGVDRCELAAELLAACRPSLVYFPEENFPKLIAVLKKYVTMAPLAKEMEDEFKKASMSWCISTFEMSLFERVKAAI